MRRLVSAVLVLALVVGAAVLTGTKSSVPKGTTYKIVFDNAFGLTEGGDFRVGGVKAGTTPKFEAVTSKSGPPRAKVTARITQKGFDDFHTDATCTIKPQSLIGEYYVDCQSGSRNAPKLNPGSTIPVTHTTSTVPIDLVNDILRRPYKERLRLIIDELGTGLAGRPKDLAAALQRAHPGLRETSKTLRTLGDQSRTIEKFIGDSNTVVSELDARKTEVSRFIKEARATAETTATRREQLRQTFRKLPGFLDELTPTMARLGDLTDAQTPLLADAQRAAPSLNTFLTRLGPFAEASRPAIKSLGKASVTGTKAFREGSQEVAELRRAGASAPNAAKPLAQFLDSLDDRRRAIDNDPRGKVGAPPASDVSNRGKANNGGFTGLESLWTYFFWQALSLNNFDNISHVLRIGLTVSECSPLENRTLQTNPELQSKFDRCKSYLGPNQPGITTPDFTRGASAASLRSKMAASGGSSSTDSDGEKTDATTPAAGQKDVSKPQVTLPPAVQKLVNGVAGEAGKKVDQKKVDKLVSGQGPQTQGGQAPSSQQLLDYLLGP